MYVTSPSYSKSETKKTDKTLRRNMLHLETIVLLVFKQMISFAAEQSSNLSTINYLIVV